MKKFLLTISILLLVISSQSKAQNFLFPAKKYSFWGFIDSKGAWISKPTDQAFDPLLLSQRAEFWAVFRTCLQALPDRIGQAFSFRVLDDMNPDDVCKVLSVTPTNLWVMLHRARARLRACLEANWFERDAGDGR